MTDDILGLARQAPLPLTPVPLTLALSHEGERRFTFHPAPQTFTNAGIDGVLQMSRFRGNFRRVDRARSSDGKNRRIVRRNVYLFTTFQFIIH